MQGLLLHTTVEQEQQRRLEQAGEQGEDQHPADDDDGERLLGPSGPCSPRPMCRIPAAARATHALASEDFVFLPAGLMFVFAGVMLALAPERAALRRLFGALLVTAFALTLDWIAFGPGERRFSGGISLGIEIGFNPGELFGRIAFGIGAAILDIIAAVLWTREIRRLLARDA